MERDEISNKAKANPRLKERERAEIAAQTEEFLKRGGKIQQLGTTARNYEELSLKERHRIRKIAEKDKSRMRP